MTDRQEAFCQEYMKDFRQTAAALRAGYPYPANNAAYKLMRNERVQKRLEELAKERRSNHQVTVTRTMKEYEKLAFFDPRDIFDELTGAMLPIHDWPSDARAAITSVQIKEETDREGNVIGYIKTVKLTDRRAALADIAKMAGMLTENVNLNIYSPDGLFEKQAPVVIDMTQFTPEQMVEMTRALMIEQAPTVDITPEPEPEPMAEDDDVGEPDA